LPELELVAGGGIDEGLFSRTYKDRMSRDKPCFHLPRRECDLIIAGHSAKCRRIESQNRAKCRAIVANKLAENFTRKPICGAVCSGKSSTEKFTKGYQFSRNNAEPKKRRVIIDARL